MSKDYRLYYNKSLSFSDCMTLLGMILGFVFFYLMPSEPGWETSWDLAFAIYKLGVITALLFIRALISNDFRGIGAPFETVWDIATAPQLTPGEKFTLIKSNLKNAVSKYNKYFVMWDKIVEENKSWDSRMARIKQLIKDIKNGEASTFQIIWIFCYSFYSLIIESHILQLPIQYDFLINFVFLAVLLYASGNIKGLTTLFFTVFTTLAGVREQDLEFMLSQLTEIIRENCDAYYFLDVAKCCYPDPTPQDKVKSAVKTLTIQIPHLSNEQIQKSLGNGTAEGKKELEEQDTPPTVEEPKTQE